MDESARRCRRFSRGLHPRQAMAGRSGVLCLESRWRTLDRGMMEGCVPVLSRERKRDNLYSF